MMANDFTQQYYRDLEKTVKKLGKKTGKTDIQPISRFCYADTEEQICLDVIMDAGKPIFINSNREKFTEFKLPYEELLVVPSMKDRFYRNLYQRLVIPDTLIDNEVSNEEVDAGITKFLSRYVLLPNEYFAIARCWIKQSWVYERFTKNPYLHIYGDWGTGKTRLGKLIMMLSHYGFVLDSGTAASLARTLDLTNCSIMLEESDYLDKNDSERFMTMLRNGYERGGFYQLTEQDSANPTNKKTFSPKIFMVDQPKIIVKRKSTRDDALSSRTITIKMIPRDKEVPREMKQDVERRQSKFQFDQARDVVNQLLNWRWHNLFKESDPPIVDDMNIRFNDTIMPLLKVASPNDREIIIEYMRAQQKEIIADISDDYRMCVVKTVAKLFREYSGLLGPTNRIFIKDIVSRTIEDYGSDMTETDAKRAFNSRAVRRALKDLGFTTEIYRNMIYIKSESLVSLLPRLCDKYNIPLIEEDDKEPERDLLAEAEILAKEQAISF